MARVASHYFQIDLPCVALDIDIQGDVRITVGMAYLLRSLRHRSVHQTSPHRGAGTDEMTSSFLTRRRSSDSI
jgi:hypothetical protein